ncbi:MAG: hypothetical protein AB1589_25525 [Cyanobacteriota bacterium]
MQEGRRQEAEGSKEENLYSKLFNLFELAGYFCRALLVQADTALLGEVFDFFSELGVLESMELELE